MRTINKIIIHCADTPASMDIGAIEIRSWHVDANGWSDIGYHYVIRRNGVVELGRDIRVAGAHTYKHNHDSIGICMVGGKDGCNFTRHQWATLERLVNELKAKFPAASVKGHRDYDSGKLCPSFDAVAWDR